MRNDAGQKSKMLPIGGAKTMRTSELIEVTPCPVADMIHNKQAKVLSDLKIRKSLSYI